MLDAIAQKEIMDYFSDIGFDVRFHGLEERGFDRSDVLAGPDLNDSGLWGQLPAHDAPDIKSYVVACLPF